MPSVTDPELMHDDPHFKTPTKTILRTRRLVFGSGFGSLRRDVFRGLVSEWGVSELASYALVGLSFTGGKNYAEERNVVV